MSAKMKVKKTKTALKQETYNLSDLKQDLKSLRVCRTWRLAGLGLIVRSRFQHHRHENFLNSSP